ncbi:hypothetical protein [Nodularia sp. LEGE 04288]|uniref:hypothetical protein n=1 Tax=Nodularia sp. LEGE 04288 TaxID=1828639 RepID=UPI001D0F69C4|nr:hypothetical protein [Nodularia sp. LEGE 04288]MCC2695386.1 hypothetical protein [Nodularia sp. LEGE 04288]
MNENKPSVSDPAINPDQSVVASQEAQPHTPTNVAGSAMLDAQAVAGEQEPQADPTNFPIATNFTQAQSTGDSKTAGVSTDMKTDVTDEQTSEKGAVNLLNHPDIPNPEQQGNLPNSNV